RSLHTCTDPSFPTRRSSDLDLNFHNPEVQDAILAAMRFWLDRGVDGFRFDTVNYYFHDRKLRDNPAAPREKETPLEVDPYGMQLDRKSTRLNSSHVKISYAV